MSSLFHNVVWKKAHSCQVSMFLLVAAVLRLAVKSLCDFFVPHLFSLMHIKAWTHYRLQHALVGVSLHRLISRGVCVSDLRGGVWLIVPWCCSPVFSSARFLSDVAIGEAAAGGVTPAYLSAELCIVDPSKWEEKVRMCPLPDSTPSSQPCLFCL